MEPFVAILVSVVITAALVNAANDGQARRPHSAASLVEGESVTLEKRAEGQALDAAMAISQRRGARRAGREAILWKSCRCGSPCIVRRAVLPSRVGGAAHCER